MFRDGTEDEQRQIIPATKGYHIGFDEGGYEYICLSLARGCRISVKTMGYPHEADTRSREQNMRKLAFAIALAALPTVANSQVVIPAHCPPGFIHEGSYCVSGEERYPFADFLRGGRFFGRPFHRNTVIVRPPIGMGRPGYGHGRPSPLRPPHQGGMGRPEGHGRH